MRPVKPVRSLVLDFSNFKNPTKYGKIHRVHISTRFSLDELTRFCNYICTGPSYRHIFKEGNAAIPSEVICDFANKSDADAFAAKFKASANPTESVFDFGLVYGQELRSAKGNIDDSRFADTIFTTAIRQSVINTADEELVFNEYETILYNIFSFKFQEYYNSTL